MEDKFLNPVRKSDLFSQNNSSQNRFSNGVKLTNTVYKVLEFFPESDPLKNRAKDKALAIMDNLVLISEDSGWASFQKEKIKVQLLEDIEIILGYLWIGKSQGWLNSVNYLIVANEYEKIKNEVGPVIEIASKATNIDVQPIVRENLTVEPKEVVSPVLDNTELEAPSFSISDSPAQEGRQKQILEFLTKNDKAQVMDLQTIFPDITKRTIRRDLDELLESGKIERLGDFNEVFYKIKG